jgi:hypothetical protein
LIFGVPLQHACRGSTTGIPKTIEGCIEAIEERGLHSEGLYRVSGKKVDLQQLSLDLEVDSTKVDLLNEQVDVHLITGVVKSFLRDLPEPLLLFPIKERIEHSLIPHVQERIKRLRQRVKSTGKEKSALLEYVISHLHKVSKYSEQNKMTISNISMIFSAVLFQQTETVEQGWFQREKSSDLDQFEFLKTDLVLQDLIAYHKEIFDSETPRTRAQGPPLPVRTPIHHVEEVHSINEEERHNLGSIHETRAFSNQEETIDKETQKNSNQDEIADQETRALSNQDGIADRKVSNQDEQSEIPLG